MSRKLNSAIIHRSAALAFASILFAALPLCVAAAPATCFATWSDAAPIVARENLVTVGEMHKRAISRDLGSIVRVTLCEDGDRFVYRLVLRRGTGHTIDMTVDARAPFEH